MVLIFREIQVLTTTNIKNTYRIVLIALCFKKRWGGDEWLLKSAVMYYM